ANLDEQRVELEIPGVSLIEIDTGTEIILEKLVRKPLKEINRAGLLGEVKQRVNNEVSLKTLHGKVNNSLRDHEKIKNDYRLETPHGVAGVRGTSFSCEANPGTTECSVLEGEVEFSSSDDPSMTRTLTAGIRATFGSALSEPDTASGLTENQKKELQETKNQVQGKNRLLQTP
ncbi:MAG: FecR domain-containing protein, partial [bacterium]